MTSPKQIWQQAAVLKALPSCQPNRRFSLKKKKKRKKEREKGFKLASIPERKLQHIRNYYLLSQASWLLRTEELGSQQTVFHQVQQYAAFVQPVPGKGAVGFMHENSRE